MSSPQSLAARIIPARGAAQKASASFADQLTDSPGRSDGDSPSPTNPFREPAQRTKNIKYRYSATGKHLSSPLKGSSSSPERKLTKPAKRMATFTPAPPSHVSKAKPPAVATTSRKRKASFRKDDVLDSIFLASPSPLSSPPTSPTVLTKDLPPSPTLLPKPSTHGSPKRLPFSKTLSLRALEPSASKFSVLSQPLSPKRKQKKNKPNVNKSLWDIGNSVWVLVSQSGALADYSAQPQDGLEQLRMWWPAQVVQKQPLRVSLFGDFPSSSSTSTGLCTIFAPSSSNVQPINDDSGAKRFSRATFCLTCSYTGDNDGPPTKKPRFAEDTSIQDRWESAVQGMEKASTLERDGLPALLSTYAADRGTYDSLDDTDPGTSDLGLSLHKLARKKTKAAGPKRKLKAQRSQANMKDDMSEDTPRSISPCLPDPTLQIPGELVLAMAPKTGSSYWPAQILEHAPGHKEKYKIKFLDDEVHVIGRDRFWTSEEEEFARCTLGEWESAVKTIEDPESGDEAGEDDTDDQVNVEDPNSLAPPPPSDDFGDLSVRAQLAYVKPVLRAILNKQYAPARNKHEAFMKGGSARSGLWKSAGVRGGLDARFVKGVQKAICKWVLRDSKPEPKGLDTVAGASGTEEPGGKQEGTSVKAVSPKVIPMATLPRDPLEDDAMQGVEGTVVLEAVCTDKNHGLVNRIPLPFESDKQVEAAEGSIMAVDGHEQQPVSLPTPTNGIVLSPIVAQASLASKSQLDLLAEVSQAVATEPSLLPSHPEVPRLKVDLAEVIRKDTSSQPSPLTPIPNEDQQPETFPQRSVLVVCEEFETLSDIEKLDYCLNVLLPETIQQLILWQCGERTSAPLLPPAEEQRLHDLGARKAMETDWVDDVMRLRAACARALGIDSNKKSEEKKTAVTPGGTRSRPRRGTVLRP